MFYPQWTSLKCGLPHQFCLGPLGGPETGWHLDMHRHVTTMHPSLLATGRPAAANACRGPRSTSGLLLIGSRVKYLPFHGWGEYVGLAGVTTRTTESSLAFFRNVRPFVQVCACLVGRNKDEGCPKHYGRLTLVRGRQRMTR